MDQLIEAVQPDRPVVQCELCGRDTTSRTGVCSRIGSGCARVQARRLQGLPDFAEERPTVPCAVCGDPTTARGGVCYYPSCRLAARNRERGLADDYQPPRPPCEVCGDPVGQRNSIGVCSRTWACYREAMRRRRAASTRKHMTPAARAALIADLTAAQGGRCTWCCRPLTENWIELDHIIPVSLGGPEDRWNRQVLDKGCNMEKGTQLTPLARQLAAEHAIVLSGDDGAPPAGILYRFGELTHEEIVALYRGD